MKIDEKYFNKKIDSTLDCFTLWLLNEYCITDAEEDKAKAILHQIAADALEAGAEAQKGEIDILATSALSQLLCSMKMGEPFSSKISDKLMSSVRQAIESATVKWEVPGE